MNRTEPPSGTAPRRARSPSAAGGYPSSGADWALLGVADGPDSNRAACQHCENMFDGAAYLEGDCADHDRGELHRIAYCVAYDVTGDRITAMRCYGSFGSIITRIDP